MANFIGQGPAGLPAGTSVVHTTPYPIVPGTRARDTSGYEYVYCEFNEPVSGAQAVQIMSDFSAQPLATTGRGPCGIACYYGTSDNAGWVQIYGRAYMQIATGVQTGGVSPSNAAACTTVGTSIPMVFSLMTSVVTPAAPRMADNSTNPSLLSGIFLEGVSLATDASIGDVTLTAATTSGSGAYHSHTGIMVPVWINYPQLVHRNFGE